MNTFRIPAAQTLFLFAHTIDTDPGLTRFVFDSWLEVVFTDSASSRMILVTAMDIRDTWSALLKNRLSQSKGKWEVVKLRISALFVLVLYF